MLGLALFLVVLGALFTGLARSAWRLQNRLLERAEEQVAVLSRRADRLAARLDAPDPASGLRDDEPPARSSVSASAARPSMRSSPAYLPTDPEFAAP